MGRRLNNHYAGPIVQDISQFPIGVLQALKKAFNAEWDPEPEAASTLELSDPNLVPGRTIEFWGGLQGKNSSGGYTEHTLIISVKEDEQYILPLPGDDEGRQLLAPSGEFQGFLASVIQITDEVFVRAGFFPILNQRISSNELQKFAEGDLTGIIGIIISDASRPTEKAPSRFVGIKCLKQIDEDQIEFVAELRDSCFQHWKIIRRTPEYFEICPLAAFSPSQSAELSHVATTEADVEKLLQTHLPTFKTLRYKAKSPLELDLPGAFLESTRHELGNVKLELELVGRSYRVPSDGGTVTALYSCYIHRDSSFFGRQISPLMVVTERLPFSVDLEAKQTTRIEGPSSRVIEMAAIYFTTAQLLEETYLAAKLDKNSILLGLMTNYLKKACGNHEITAIKVGALDFNGTMPLLVDFNGQTHFITARFEPCGNFRRLDFLYADPQKAMTPYPNLLSQLLDEDK